jgi:hypothetical protein
VKASNLNHTICIDRLPNGDSGLAWLAALLVKMGRIGLVIALNPGDPIGDNPGYRDHLSGLYNDCVAGTESVHRRQDFLFCHKNASPDLCSSC